MEAFLTLTDKDLKELGIRQRAPRKTILTAITELQTGKVKLISFVIFTEQYHKQYTVKNVVPSSL